MGDDQFDHSGRLVVEHAYILKLMEQMSEQMSYLADRRWEILTELKKIYKTATVVSHVVGQSGSTTCRALRRGQRWELYNKSGGNPDASAGRTDNPDVLDLPPNGT